MARPIGTKYIKVDELQQLWDDYKKEIKQSRDSEQVATGKGDVVSLQREKPLTRQGFEAFVYRKKKCLVKQYIENQDGLYEDYMGVVSCMRNEWEEDQISGTLTGKYKAQTLVARLNGYSDKQEIKNEGSIEINFKD